MNGTLPSATGQLTNIIRYISRIGNNQGEGGQVRGLNFSLNNFIPKNKGFYHYVASLPWDPCDKCTDYIVYNLSDASINLDNMTMGILNKIISKNNIVNTGGDIDTNKLGYSYNKRGAIFGFGNNDNIWISCHPTGQEGEILVDESKSGVLSNNGFGMFFSLYFDHSPLLHPPSEQVSIWGSYGRDEARAPGLPFANARKGWYNRCVHLFRSKKIFFDANRHLLQRRR